MAWIRAHAKPVAIVAAVLIVLGIGLCRGRSTPLPPRERATIDSLRATNPDFVQRIDTLVQRESVFVERSARKAAVADRTHDAADSLRGVAIALQARAEASGDTLSQWRATALAWRRTADSLDVETETLRAARDAEKAARLQADARAASERARRIVFEDLAGRLAADVKGAKGGWLARIRDRVGVQAGYGVVASNDGAIHHGPAISVGVKVWP